MNDHKSEIRLEIWVGNEYAEEGHVQDLTENDLPLLQPVIGEEAVARLVDIYRRYASDDEADD